MGDLDGDGYLDLCLPESNNAPATTTAMNNAKKAIIFADQGHAPGVLGFRFFRSVKLFFRSSRFIMTP